MSTPNLSLEPSQVIAAVAKSSAVELNAELQDPTPPIREVKTAGQGATLSTSLEDMDSGDVAGCDGGGCLAVA